MNYHHYRIIPILVYISLAGLFCGTIPTDTSNSGPGSLNLLVWVNKSSNTPLTRETTWSKLVVMVSATDLNPILDTFPLSMTSSFYSFTFADIPAGQNRIVSTWTLDNAGDTIHGIGSKTATIEPAKTTQVVVELNPVKGSIYAVLTDIPTSIDYVELYFTKPDISWKTRSKRETKLHMSLDKIPYDTATPGTLSIVGYDTSIVGQDTIKDTVASWKKDSFYFVNSNMTINASFISVGKITIQVTLNYPGVTIITGIMNIKDSLDKEKGGLIITEIMYSSSTDNDTEYVEIYNTSDIVFNDTIILQKDNGTERVFKVTISPKNFFVIGRINLPWADTFHTTNSALDFAGTGNWLSIRAKDASLMDLVVFQGGSNNQEWPNFSTSLKASIVLDSLPDNPEYNNFGRNWIRAQSYIDSTITKQLGTPGKAGS